MDIILNIDTATEVCSVCISENDRCLDIRESHEERSHASVLTVFINDILEKNKLTIDSIDAVAVSKGPGSYTGLRIGVSAAKGLCYAADKPLIAISTLQAMCYGVKELYDDIVGQEEKIIFCPMIDARRMEVYTALYNSDCQPLSKVEAKIIDQHSFTLHPDKKLIFFGSGAVKCKEVIRRENTIFMGNFIHTSQCMIPLAEKAFKENKFENINSCNVK